MKPKKAKRVTIPKTKTETVPLNELTVEVTPTETAEWHRKVTITNEAGVKEIFYKKHNGRDLQIQLGGKRQNGWLTAGTLVAGDVIDLTVTGTLIF